MFLSASLAALSAVTIPAGTELAVRLRSEVSSSSKTGSPVSAVLIQPVIVDGSELVPAGAAVEGTVAAARAKAKPDGSAILLLDFTRIGPVPVKARVAAVDNARESVDGSGTIRGLKPLRARPGKIEDVLLLAAHAHPLVLATVLAGKLVLSRLERPHVRFAPGIEMTLSLTSPADVTTRWPADRVQPLPEWPGLRDVVNAEPLRTEAEHPRQPSDMTNILFMGEEESLRAAFEGAGWSTAAAINLKTECETFLAVADRHSFRQAPVSTLLLDGSPPDLVFQKQNNTFAKRHHIRIWRREDFDNRPVWVGAATHDIGIVFSREARTFTHKVESDVDIERNKVFYDLCFTGLVQAGGFVSRPAAPERLTNATGDSLRTDGAMAVIVLR